MPLVTDDLDLGFLRHPLEVQVRSRMLSFLTCLQGLQLCSVERQTVEIALGLGLKDFEDAIQLSCAMLSQLDGIVTRNQKDFIGSNLPIYTPSELLQQLS